MSRHRFFLALLLVFAPATATLAASSENASQALETSDFFADDVDLTRSVARLAQAISMAESAEALVARKELDAALDDFGRHLLKARSRGVGPLTQEGNKGLEARASLAALECVALHRLGEHLVIRDKLRALKRPLPKFTATDLVGIPQVERGDPSRPQIALTFDDGPEKPHTREVLDVLKAQGVKGTFFIVGKAAKKNPDLLRRVYNEGHELGHHSWDHPRLTRLSSREIQDQIERTDEIFSQVLPELGPVSLFRLPYQIGNRSKLVQSVLARRYDYLVDWSVDSKDYAAKSPEEILSNTLRQSQKNGAIVLYHDRRPHTAAAVNVLIETLRSKGFQFVTVSEVMGTDPAGNRSDQLVKGIQAISRSKPHEAARAFGNFTLRNPEAQGAPIALFASYYLASWIDRPKTEKLRAALGRRYPESLFGKLVLGKLPEYPYFLPGGRIAVPPPDKIDLIEEDLSEQDVPALPAPVTLRSPAPETREEPKALPSPTKTPVTSTTLAASPAAPPAVLEVSRKTRPRILVKTTPMAIPTLVRELAGHRSSARLGLPGGRREPLDARLPLATPLPTPYQDPEPELDGSHMVDPDSI